MSRIFFVNEPITRGETGRLQYRVITLCALVLVFDGYDVGAIGYVLPALARAWAKSPSDLTLAIVLGGIGMLAGSMIAGPLGDMRGRKPVFVASIAIFGIFSIATAFAESSVSLSLLRFLTGMGLGGGIPAAVALTSDYVPRKNRALVVGMMTCGVPVGLMLGGLVSSRLIPAYGWQTVFLLGGILPLLSLPVLARWLPESQMLLREGHSSVAADVSSAQSGSDEAVPGRILTTSSRPIWFYLVVRLFRDGYAVRTSLLWTMFFCNFLAHWLMVFWLPSILSAAGATDADAAFYSALLPLGGLAGIGAIALITRYGRIEWTLAMMLLLGALATGAMWGLKLPPIATAVTIGSIGMGLMGAQFGMNGLCGAAYPPDIRATGLGWAFGIGRVGNIVGPGLGGLILAASFPPRTMLLVSVGAALVAAIAMFLLGRESAAGRLDS